MQKFLIKLEPRLYDYGGDYIQDQNIEVSEIFFIMKGKVGVGYTLYNELFFGLALYPKNIINDYAMIRERVSEFAYLPIIDHVEGLAMRKHDFKHLFMKSFWR